MTKPNKDGWIRHRGGKCPVEEGTLVDVRYRDGEIKYGLPANENADGNLRDAGPAFFRHDNAENDIMAWRPHKPEQKSISSVAADGELWSDAKEMRAVVIDYSPSLHIQSFGRVYRHEGDPRVMRDRIREIDAASKEEEARHCAAMAAYDKERTSLVAKLKAEGFVLVDEPNSAA